MEKLEVQERADSRQRGEQRAVDQVSCFDVFHGDSPFSQKNWAHHNMTPAYCQPINSIKVYKFAIFLAQDQNRSAYGAARMKGGHSLSAEREWPPFILFHEREYPPLNPPRERFRLAVSGLNNLYAFGMQLPARGVAALGVAIRFDFLLLSAAALPIL